MGQVVDVDLKVAIGAWRATRHGGDRPTLVRPLGGGDERRAGARLVHVQVEIAVDDLLLVRAIVDDQAAMLDAEPVHRGDGPLGVGDGGEESADGLARLLHRDGAARRGRCAGQRGGGIGDGRLGFRWRLDGTRDLDRRGVGAGDKR